LVLRSFTTPPLIIPYDLFSSFFVKIGTFNMLEAVRSAGLTKTVRFLLAGSSTEYGATADSWDGPIPEHAPLSPVSPYGVSKASAELLVRQYFHTYKMNVITARFFIQVAAGGTDSLAVHEFCRQIAMIERGLQKPIIRHGTLTTKRDMTDMRDSANVVVSLAETGLPGEAYNIGSGIAVAVKDVLDIAISFSKNKGIITKEDVSRMRLYDEKILLSDNSKVRKLTGWVPNPDIKQTVLDILNFWRVNVNRRYPNEQDQGNINL
jgi:GDP-4-dehydro-6-deoxy-D-mannose reductase